MRALVVSADGMLAAKVQEIIRRGSTEQPSIDVATLEAAAACASRARHDLAVFVMPPGGDTGVMALRELHSVTRASILAVGPVDDPKHILRVLREGANEYLDERELESELESALIRIKVRRFSYGGQGRVVGLLAPSGGCGSTTVAANLATALAKRHQRTALFDLRLPAGDLALLMDLEPTHTLADLCRNSHRMDTNMVQQVLTRHESGVQLLAAPATGQEADHVTSEGVRQALGFCQTMFPHIVLDLDSTLGSEQAAAIARCELILLVLRLDMTCLRNARRIVDNLAQIGVPDGRMLGVVNRHGQPRQLPAHELQRALGVKISHFVPDDPASVNLANNHGVPVVLERPRAKVSKSLFQLAEDVTHFSASGRVNGSNGRARWFDSEKEEVRPSRIKWSLTGE